MRNLQIFIPTMVSAALLIFAVGLGSQTAAFAEEKQSSPKLTACDARLKTCQDNCRNGVVLPIGTSQAAISKCYQFCSEKLARKCKPATSTSS
jgi:hypothetical protein